MKESGINYFYNNLSLNTGSFAILYTFEQGGGTNIASISGAQSGFSGTLNSSDSFWNSFGSGFFSGTTLTINNASELDSTAWTRIFVYEKINIQSCVLFDSLNGISGCRIGITKANKPYFEGFNQQPIVAASLNNYGSKNVISFTYMPNYLTIGLYNWNSKTVESEFFSYPFELVRSDIQKLGNGQFTGYMDTYIHLTQPLSPDTQAQLLSGLFAIPTGTGYLVTNTYTTGITGYQNVFVFSTGVTGYIITPGGDDGQGYYTGAFPTSYSQTLLTGYLSTGLYSSGLSGINVYPTTGDLVTLFQYLTGYASSFGMEKIQGYFYLSTGDIIKNAVSYVPFEDIYNKTSISQYSGYLIDPNYNVDSFNLYLNGIALANQGWSLTGSYITITGTSLVDSVFYDVKNGSKSVLVVTGAPSTVAISYSGQELYLNGVNLVSGLDYIKVGSVLSLTAVNSGITGYLSEYPIILSSQTGKYTLWTGAKFWRDTTNLYRNGVRQENKVLYIEGSLIDKLSGNAFDTSICSTLYSNSDLFWNI